MGWAVYGVPDKQPRQRGPSMGSTRRRSLRLEPEARGHAHAPPVPASHREPIVLCPSRRPHLHELRKRPPGIFCGPIPEPRRHRLSFPGLTPIWRANSAALLPLAFHRATNTGQRSRLSLIAHDNYARGPHLSATRLGRTDTDDDHDRPRSARFTVRQPSTNSERAGKKNNFRVRIPACAVS